MEEKLNSLTFAGFSDYSVGTLLRRTIIEYECGEVRESSLSYLRSSLFHKKIRFNISASHGKEVVAFQSYVNRESTRNQFDAFCGIYPMTAILQREPYGSEFSGLGFIFNRFIPWFFVLLKIRMPFKLKCYLIKQLSLVSTLKEFLDGQNFLNYKLAIAFNDSNVLEGFFIHYFKHKNCKTATLQHGQFTSWRDNNIINSGVELRCVQSDFFLSWNKMTVSEASKVEECNSEFHIVGILGNITGIREESENPRNKCFGVIIDHPQFIDNNLKLIESANILAKNIGYKYYLKLHPNYKPDFFDEYVDPLFFAGIVKKGIQILQYANSVEFSLVASSSVFVELVYVNHKTLRYSNGSVDDKFRDISCDAHFNNPVDIIDAYYNSESNQVELFEQLCGCKDVKNQYVKFISDCLNS